MRTAHKHVIAVPGFKTPKDKKEPLGHRIVIQCLHKSLLIYGSCWLDTMVIKERSFLVCRINIHVFLFRLRDLSAHYVLSVMFLSRSQNTDFEFLFVY